MNTKTKSKPSSNANARFDSSLIRKPRQQPRLHRTLWGAVNVAFWAFLMALCIPLLTLLSWLFGIRLAWRQLYEYQDQVDPFLLMAAPVILLCCALGLIGWAEYNRLRFSGSERRSAIAPIDIQQIARDLGASDALAKGLAGSKSVVLHMDEQARPVGFTRQQSMPKEDVARNRLKVVEHHDTTDDVLL
ncbi:poly-beta-1,6-N-acetyl-D-glucosamine biosynthesis protein PgaD [Stenotrophomonas sp. Iso1]|uniref:poly-beta-1,6-N-acetyl-D-glucosamine biosynthesis protein PgaD n=1 Tax=Stenotrophomonas sp. Iso1 TaxID=2977283 RepID=UPI0022B7B950|nr:poly-beta-1,6-N-acetyl-D-glucosamine biosynthesis protein PgaD [Stenotrophomonas sp. Iso1]